MLRNAVALAHKTARRVDGTTVTYSRGSQSASGIAVAMGTSEYEVEQADGLLAELHTADFLVAVCDLADFGLPQENDEITANLGGVDATFIVTAPSPEPAWRYSDNYRTTYRIHTKRING